MNRREQERDARTDPRSNEWLENTRLFQYWASMKQDILLHKWYESERAGHDVGWERASTSWMIHHRRRFDASHRPSA
ncbi:MAG TPA: DUF4032 domain-containing protein [Kiritimatiellia bacterium]|nr:DUF4032 domain-containing protein [Kiritimatiellia bacterium]HMP97262.1 DUF4032 domain-containing protein [Kiritimatiellia bacterium]